MILFSPVVALPELALVVDSVSGAFVESDSGAFVDSDSPSLSGQGVVGPEKQQHQV